MDQIFNTAMFAVCTISCTFCKLCWAATMLSIIVWSEAVQTTISLHFSWIFSILAWSIAMTTQDKKAATALPNHSLHQQSTLVANLDLDPRKNWRLQLLKRMTRIFCAHKKPRQNLLVCNYQRYSQHNNSCHWSFPFNNFFEPR